MLVFFYYLYHIVPPTDVNHYDQFSVTNSVD